MARIRRLVADFEVWRAIDIRSRAVPLLGKVRTDRDRLAWLAARRSGIGASEIASVLDLPGAYRSPFSLWWAKQPGWDSGPDQPTEEEEWGHRLEPAIAGKFAELHAADMRVYVPPASLWRHPLHPWMTCTPDRLVVDYSGALFPLELKTDQNASRWTDDDLPEIYRVQLLWQCAVFGVPAGFVAALVNKHYREYAVEFEADEIAETVAAGAAFWASLNGEPPDIDAHSATRETLQQLNPAVDKSEKAFVSAELAAAYRAAYREAKDAEELLREAENRLRAVMGTAYRAVDPSGRAVVTRIVSKVEGHWRAPGVRDYLRNAGGAS